MDSVIKIELDLTRSKLGEGRQIGIGHAFLKKIAENHYKAVQPVSPCKDYLNDVVYVEVTEAKSFSACGLTAHKAGIFDTHGYLVTQSCEQKYSLGAAPRPEEVKLLAENTPNTQKVINEFEAMFKIKDRTELTPVSENVVFAKVPLEWCRSSWMISLWGYIYRNAIYNKGDVDAVTAITDGTKFSGDNWHIGNVLAAIKKITAEGIPVQKEWNGVHGNGIVAWMGH